MKEEKEVKETRICKSCWITGFNQFKTQNLNQIQTLYDRIAPLRNQISMRPAPTPNQVYAMHRPAAGPAPRRRVVRARRAARASAWNMTYTPPTDMDLRRAQLWLFTVLAIAPPGATAGAIVARATRGGVREDALWWVYRAAVRDTNAPFDDQMARIAELSIHGGPHARQEGEQLTA
jgi:hypothetical protein